MAADRVTETWTWDTQADFETNASTTGEPVALSGVSTTDTPGAVVLEDDQLAPVAVAAGTYHTVGLRSDGTAVAVGNNTSGQLNVSGWTDIVAVAAGGDHTVGLRSDGTAVAVGNNASRQLNVSGWTDLVAVAAGTIHTVGLRSDGTAVAVGSNSGQCNVSAWTDLVAVAAGTYHTVGLRSDGTAVAVGNNAYGQLDVSGWTDLVAVTAGQAHTVGLRSDGTAVAVGNNDYGQLDVRVMEARSNVTPMAASDSYTTVAGTTLSRTSPGVLANDTDSDGDPLTAVKVTGPSHGTLTLNADGSFTYSPAAGFSGIDSFKYKATDGRGDSNTVTVAINVRALAAPVEVALPYSPKVTLVGQDVEFGFSFATDSLYSWQLFKGSSLVNSGSFSETGGSISLSSSALSPGTYRLIYRSCPWSVDVTQVLQRDSQGNYVYVYVYDYTPLTYAMTSWQYEFDVVVVAPVDAVTAYIDGVSPNPSDRNDRVILTGYGTDSLGHALSGYSWRSSVDGVLSGSSSFSTTSLSPGTHTIFFKAQCSSGAWSPEVSTTVRVINVSPVLAAIGDKSVVELQALTFEAGATDADADALTFTLIDAPSGASMNPTTGRFSWTPTEAQDGAHQFTVVVSDGHGGTDSETITVTVDEVNAAPVLAPIGNKSVNELVALTFTAFATDSDLPKQTLTFTLGAGAPAGAAITSAGVFAWTPTEAQGPGTYPITVTVSDGNGGTDSETITVTVAEVTEPVNSAPVLAPIGNKSVNELATLSFRASATDADGDTLTFALVGAPTGALINTSTGIFSWTPTEAQGPGTYTFTVRVSDGALTASETITVTVAEVPDAPATLTITPVAGIGRVETAIEASKLGFPSSTYVLVATARSFPDALGGSALAGALDAPILLTEPGTLSPAVSAEIARLGASHVIVLGGTGAVSADVYAALDALPSVTTIERLFGDNRYTTADAIAKRTITENEAWDGTAFVATGESFPDALGGSPIAAAKGWPIYLVHPNAANHDALVATMKADGVTSALILGGTGPAPATFETKLNAAFTTAKVDRLAGANRYATAVAVATYGVNTAGLSWDGVAIATGENFPDALSGGALQGASGSVMLLAYPGYLHTEVATVLTANKAAISEVRFLGGTGAVPQVIRDAVVQKLQ